MSEFEGVDSALQKYGSVDVAKKIFSGKNIIQKYMEIEAALATTQAALGIIPKEAAEEINRKCDVNLLDEEEYWRQRKLTGHGVVCLLRVYKDICDNGAGEYIHFGATSQDITDTALMLQMLQVHELVLRKLETLKDLIRERAKKYRGLVMMGRTHGQQANPVTLGYKLASWLDELNRGEQRLRGCRERVFVGQFSGAVGTMASVGEQGVDIQAGLMKMLGLSAPDISWHSSRDRIAEFTCNLALLCCTLGRIGNEIFILQQSEINEIAEGFRPGKVGSSTMPHKRNPNLPSHLAALGRMARSQVVDALTSMESSSERDLRIMKIEPYCIENICCLADAALDTAIELITDLEVHEDAIRRNLHLSDGLIFAEAVMMRLSKEYGRMEAHEMVYHLAQKAISEGKSFQSLLLDDPAVSKVLSPGQLSEIMNPANYIGLSEYFTDKLTQKNNRGCEDGNEKA